MKQQFTQQEIERTQQLCFNNPAKACAVAQLIADTCQVVSCATYAEIKGKSPRAVQYKAETLTGIEIENRRFVSVNQ
jgi:hypothetical protein